jgi:hypothetical protein
MAIQYVVKRVGLVFLCYRKLPENGILVPKHLGVLIFVIKCTLLGAFFGLTYIYIHTWRDTYTNLDYLLSTLGMGTNNVK